MGKRFLILEVLVLLPFIVNGCNKQEMRNEFSDKSEYSILQSYEYEYREIKNDKPYMIFKHALKTNATVVAFPIMNMPKGYVVILAQAEGSVKVKSMPNAEFLVTQSIFEEVKLNANLSKDVEKYIEAHVR
jgi:hypothetical protein